MIAIHRNSFNERFSEIKHKELLDYVDSSFGVRPEFRIAETPIFVNRDIRKKLLEACELISDEICKSDFKQKTHRAIPLGQEVAGEDEHTLFLQMDFGLCATQNEGEILPQLIEVQGFPSLYFYQYMITEAYKKVYDLPNELSPFFGGLDTSSYIEYLKRHIVGASDAQNIVLLEIEPSKQATHIDFAAIDHYLGVKSVCISDVKKEGREVYYINDQGKKIGIEKIFNRVIFDELLRRNDLDREFYFSDNYDVEWIGHPNWFFRISKYALPFFDNKYVPKTYFLNDMESYPDDLENYVLKPLFSFSGMGVELHIKRGKLEQIKDAENWILQKKVNYSPLITTPDDPAKCEIRILMIWEKEAPRPRIITSLVRLSKGEMVGVKYNKNRAWVGSSAAFYEV